MNLDELTPEQRAAVEAVLREAPTDTSLDLPARPGWRALMAAYAVGGEQLAYSELCRVANGLVRSGLVVGA